MFEDYKIDIPTATVHPVYNDLDPYFEYKMENINLAYDNSVELIMCLICKLRENENTVSKYKLKSKSGIRIANFINTLEYDNNILRDQIELYINYCDFFQGTQNKYFNKLLEKIKALQNDIDEDIKIHETQWDEDDDDEDEDQIGSQWMTNPLVLTHPVHYEPATNDPVSNDPVSNDPSGSEPNDPSGSNPLTDINWGIAIQDFGKEDEDKEEDEFKSPTNKKKNKKNKK
jgi:hypothetical protein